VQVCKAGAIAHNQQETSAYLNVGAIICADSIVDSTLPEDMQGVYRVTPEDPLSASAASANVLVSLGKQPVLFPRPVVQALSQSEPRIGAFICECGDHISSIIDTNRVRKKLAALPDVVHTQVLPFSCSPEAAETIRTTVDKYELGRVVLAACSCCAVDQACYSCTYQRLRSRQNLGVLPGSDGHFPGLDAVDFEFVNIREQCAWVHVDDPKEATAKAIALTTAAVARVRGEVIRPRVVEPIEQSLLILGSGEAASACEESFKKIRIPMERAEDLPDQITRTNGRYLALRGDQSWAGQALVMAPQDSEEAENLLTAFGREELRPRIQSEWGGLAADRPGVYFCDPNLDPDLTGRAMAARAAAWLGRIKGQILQAATVDPARCRACGTCVEICEFGAPELTGETPIRAARIDPVVCVNCGTCAAHCPSGAISLANTEGAELESTLSTILAGGD
jgi:ferredoxin